MVYNVLIILTLLMVPSYSFAESTSNKYHRIQEQQKKEEQQNSPEETAIIEPIPKTSVNHHKVVNTQDCLDALNDKTSAFSMQKKYRHQYKECLRMHQRHEPKTKEAVSKDTQNPETVDKAPKEEKAPIEKQHNNYYKPYK